eukprot:scaffold2339_cov54-Attheya_sp.AAC.2
MAEPTALRLHDNQPFQDQLGHAVHLLEAPMMAHLMVYECQFKWIIYFPMKGLSICRAKVRLLLQRYGVNICVK